jgi:hypothetical protein
VLPSGRITFVVTLMMTEIRNNLAAIGSFLAPAFFHKICALTRAARDVSVTNDIHRYTYRGKEYFPDGEQTVSVPKA